MVTDSQALRVRITDFWNTLTRPESVIDLSAPEEPRIGPYLTGKQWHEIDFTSEPFGLDSLFLTVTVPAQLYYLGGLMLHLLDVGEAGEDGVKPSFSYTCALSPPLLTLAGAFVLDSNTYLEFGEEMAARPDCFAIVGEFACYLFSKPSVAKCYPEEGRLILEFWRSLENLFRRLAELRERGEEWREAQWARLRRDWERRQQR